MRSLLRLALLTVVLVASAPEADAQLGGLVDRARRAVTGQGGESAPRPSDGPAPAFDFGTLLDTQFWPAQGSFHFGSPADYFLLFPPSDYDQYETDGRYVVRNEAGRVVGTSEMRGAGPTGTPNIVEVDTQSPPFSFEGAGAYTLDVEFEGQTIAQLPFTATIDGGDDPFDTRTAMRLDGPWRTHAYFQHEIDRPEYIMTFNAWMRRDEPGGDEATVVSIRRDGQEVAYGSGYPNGSGESWVRVEYRLRSAEGRDGTFRGIRVNTPNWTAQDVTPGAYEIVILTEGDGVVRTFTAQGAENGFVPHDRSDVAIESRPLFLTPRRMTGQNLRTATQLYWIAPETL